MKKLVFLVLLFIASFSYGQAIDTSKWIKNDGSFNYNNWKVRGNLVIPTKTDTSNKVSGLTQIIGTDLYFVATDHKWKTYVSDTSALHIQLVTQLAAIQANASAITGKQSLLNGTGFVKATGTSISYDNTSYVSDTSALHNNKVDKATTIKINGITKDLNGNQDWGTIGGTGGTTINGTGFVKANGTTVSYDNSTYLTSESDPKRLSSIAVTGTTTKTFTATLADASTVSTTFTDATGGGSSSDTSSNYVSNFGSNANNGLTATAPKQTVSSSEAVVNNKASTLGSAKLYYEAGSVFREQFTATTNNITFGNYNLNDASSSNVNKSGYPILSGADVQSSGFNLLGGTSFTYQKSISHTIRPGLAIGDYGYMNVIEIDTALEKIQPITARRYLIPANTLAQLDTMAGSYYTGTTAANPVTLSIHTSDGASPNNHSKYRYEVTIRDKGIKANSDGTNTRSNITADGLYIRDFGSGYGGINGGNNVQYNHIIFGASGQHHTVNSSGTIKNSLFLGGARFVTAGAAIFYSTAGYGEHNRIQNTIFLDVPSAIAAHTSGGISHAALDLNNVISFPDTLSPEASYFIPFTTNTDSLLVTNCYVDGHYSVTRPLYISNSYSLFKNSIFRNFSEFGDGGNRAYFNNCLFVTNKGGTGPYANGTYQNISNSIIHFKNNGVTVPANATGSSNITSSTTIFKGNILIADNTNGGTTNMANYVPGSSSSFSGNIYIVVKGIITWTVAGVGGPYSTLSSFQSGSGQDANSILIDLRADSNGLRSVFIDPDNGNYNLVKGGWGDTIRNRGAGMVTPPSYFLKKPSKEQAYEMVINDKIPSINNIFNVGNIGQQNITTQGNNFNGISQLIQTTSDGKYPALNGVNITNVIPSLANSTIATSGAGSLISPSLPFSANSYKTSATAGSIPVTFQAYLQTFGGTSPTGTLTFNSSVNGSAFANPITMTTAGVLNAPTVTGSNGNFTNSTIQNIYGVGIQSNGTAIGTTSTILFSANNDVGATIVNQTQYSRAYSMNGAAWNGSASQSANLKWELRPIPGTSPITSKAVWAMQIAGGTYADKLALNSDASITHYTTPAEPPTPAAGTVVEWWDGTNKKWKKSDGTTGVIY